MKILSQWWGAAVLLCLVCLTVAWLRPNNTQAAEKRSPPVEPLMLLWQRPIADFRGAALSPQGELIALTSGPKGAVSLWHWRTQPDHPLWVHAATNASEVAVSATGSFVLAWSGLDPAQPEFTVLQGEDGATLSHRTLDGAIWAAQLSTDGCYAGVATGGKSLYLYTLSDQPYRPGKREKRIHQWSLGGIGNSIDFTTAGSYLVTGSWDDSGVACYTPRGTCLWRYPEDSAARHKMADRLFTAQLSGNGQYVLGTSYGNVRESDPILYLWRSDGGGNPQWKMELGEDAFYPRAQITSDGRYVAVSYLRQIVRGDQSLSERYLRVMDNNGVTIWERGGLLFSPTLVALAPDGRSILVSDGRRTLHALGKNGRILRSYALPGLLRQTALSADGHMLLVYTGDGTLSLYRVG
ncbi:MAG: WD40 repeat domain-containing protein [Armatimonadota bacterium]|nr:WD40 repeat domain-containing protein [Armatimonadota bacterium]